MNKYKSTEFRAAIVMLSALISGCNHAESAASPLLARVPAFAPILASDFHILAGAKRPLGLYKMRVDVGGMRGVASKSPGRSAELAFSYHGPSVDEARLADGELRRQIGISLQEQDVCNVIYVMWHIEPTAGVFVSVKTNAGQSTHAECLDHGYTIVNPTIKVDAPIIRPEESHILRAKIEDDTLHVWIDRDLVWEGTLPTSARTLNGPIGVRSDNGDFDFELRKEQLEH